MRAGGESHSKREFRMIVAEALLIPVSASRSHGSGGLERTRVCEGRPTNEVRWKRRLTRYCASARSR